MSPATEVHQNEPWHSVQGPSVHCPSLPLSATFQLTFYSPYTTPLSRVYLFWWHFGTLGSELRLPCMKDV